jgi:hypothetical protein
MAGVGKANKGRADIRKLLTGARNDGRRKPERERRGKKKEKTTSRDREHQSKKTISKGKKKTPT